MLILIKNYNVKWNYNLLHYNHDLAWSIGNCECKINETYVLLWLINVCIGSPKKSASHYEKVAKKKQFIGITLNKINFNMILL